MRYKLYAVMNIDFKMNEYNEFTIIKNKQVISRISFKNYCRDDICNNQPGVYVRDIYTLEGYRSMGFATQLINKVINYCKVNNIKYILLDDCTDMPKHNNLYRKLGFSVQLNDDKWVLWDDAPCDYIVCEERVYFID